MLTPFFTFLFFAALELQTLVYQESTVMLFALPVLAFSLAWYYSQRVSFSVIALLHGVVASLFLSLFQNGVPAQIIAIISAGIFFLFLSLIEARRPRALVLVSFYEFLAFFFLLLSYRLYFETPLWLLGFSAFLFILSLFSSSLSIMLEVGLWLRVRLFAFSIVVAAIMTELFLVFGNLSLHPVNIDFLLFFVYYTLWDITLRYFAVRFTKQSLVISIALLLFGISSVVFFSRWLPH